MYFIMIKFVKKLTIMKFFALVVSILFLSSCAVKEAYTKELKEKLSIDTDAEMRKLQFYTSGTIILEEVLSGTQEFKTDANGVIIPNSTKVKEKIIIPANTKCIFDEFGEKDKIMVRFEEGKEKTLTFDVKPNNKRYYLDLDPNQAGGPKIKYGKKTYKVDLLNSGGTSVYLLIKKTNQQTRTRGRVVRGMKV
jgi:hypothetical protein